MKAVVLSFLVALASHAACEVFFEETFDSDPFESGRWISSKWKPSEMGEWKWTSGDWFVDEVASKGLQTTADLKHHAAGAKISKPFSNEGKTLVLQFTVKHEKKEYAFCGGGYIKLLPSSVDLETFGGSDKYHVMFGPDLCGYDVSRIHAIFRDNKDNNLLKKDEAKLDYDEKNEFTHLYRLVVNPDHTYKIFFDDKEKASGSLHDDWDFPKKTIDDPEDKKPEDWVEEKEIDDPQDVKPEGYDDTPKEIPDPDSTKPDEWNDELDGDWEPSLVPNPAYKGEWKAKRIPNPAYKGEWKAKQIDNPDYYEAVGVYEDIGAVGFELWTVNNGTIFDNILVTDDLKYAEDAAAKYWKPRSEGEKAAKEKWEESKKVETVKDDGAEEVNADDEEKPKDEL